tara:strand:- start:15 stop:617 length:603 start_codon:yes stop_codon:yes gene_type:complete
MTAFVIQLLSVIFVILIAGSVQSISADHSEPGIGIFKDETEVELVTIQDSNYQVYLQTVLRNGDGKLISVTEGSIRGYVVPHKVTDHIFDTLMGKKEIVTIDNIKYEKVQYTFSPTIEQRTEKIYPIFEEIHIEYVVEDDALVQMKEEIRDYYRWQIHYCATFEGHAYTCIPVFQTFAVVELVTYTDIVTHQWTILRVLN